MGLARLADAGRLGDLAATVLSVRVDAHDADLVSFGHYRPRLWRNYWHTHSFYEVCLVYAGHGSFRSGDHELGVSPGTVFLARPGDVHEIESSVEHPLGIAYWGFTLRARRRTTDQARGWWTGLIDPGGPLLSDATGSLPLLIEGLAAEAAQPRAGVSAVVGALATALVIETGRAFATPADLADDRPQRPDPDAALTTVMWQYMRDNLGRSLIVRDIAAQVHVSERHAQRIFHAQTGQSLQEALRQVRMEQAAHLLLDTGLPVHEIGHRCGYRDARAFSTAFGRHFGQTATSFRRTVATRQLTPYGRSG